MEDPSYLIHGDVDRSLEAGKADEGDAAWMADTADLAMHLLPHEAKLPARMVDMIMVKFHCVLLSSLALKAYNKLSLRSYERG